MSTSQVVCPCGALYERTELIAGLRETDRFACAVCGETLEIFTTTQVPSYRLIAGPIRIPKAGLD
jgi:transposase-like protein